ncbi:MAG: type II toxin-antitoxin system RelE/ParE family toxin [Methyloceanibacter sp.]|uniref:type II toxin-antitoxin system RelE/ParE family toxin n=1 Tax=Methyloceanibacter sp. TaxID=1965321 RepID=UPI003D6D509A
MTIRFAAAAEAELDSVIAYYEGVSPGLGLNFLDEVDSALSRVAGQPHAWQELELGIRRCLLHRFPYAVIYACQADIILVLGVTHLHREPRGWRTRLKEADT